MNDSTLKLLSRYDVATPRYTSYPTVPYWDFSQLTVTKWKETVIETFIAEKNELSIYIHLPFCESLCTFCACNKRITTNHSVENKYINTVLKEWQLYKNMLPQTPVIKEIHLGGGTPTFFSPANLVYLIQNIIEGAVVTDDHEFSVEIHPNFTTEEHIKKLAASGFSRMSIGVQDFDPRIQFVINRMQTYEQTKQVFVWARKYGFKSINVDLIYGLPHQDIDSVEHTIGLIRQLKPDRIAFYSYAHVPWKSKAQRRYTENDLPPASLKWAIYERGRYILKKAGFKSIGMDHFALADDPLFIAAEEGSLRRNFMGYTTTQSKLIIGLGASSISASKNAFAQNEKAVEEYEAQISNNILPLVNGHLLDEKDLAVQQSIHELMCLNKTILHKNFYERSFENNILGKLLSLQEDGLVILQDDKITVTETGKLFIRNICAVLDPYLFTKDMHLQTFSRAI